MKRNLQLDNIKGLLLIIMLIDHLHLHLSKLTNNTLGYSSAAEGFIFVSGLVAGMVYIARAKSSNISKVFIQAQKRSFTIYKFHIILYSLSLLLFLNSGLIRQYWSNSYLLFATDPVNALVLGFLLLYQADLNDILPMYSIFLLLMPFVIKAFLKNKVVFVIAISLALYGLAQIDVVEIFTAWFNRTLGFSADLGYFNLLSWQLLFVLGLFAGHLEINNPPRWLAFKTSRPIFLILISFLIVCFLLRHSLNKELPYASLLINRSHLGPLRLLNFLAIAFVLNYLITRYRPRIISSFLVFLGRNSLQVFAFHVIMAVCLAPMVPMIMKQGVIVEVVFTIIVVLSLWIPAFLTEIYHNGFHLKLARKMTHLH